MKKIGFILISFVLILSLTIGNAKQASANPLVLAGAVPAGITIGAGAYTVGAYALAGLVGIAGYDTYSEEINAHALGVWENGTQLSKDSMNLMINAANNYGNDLQNLHADFQNWYGTIGMLEMAKVVAPLSITGAGTTSGSVASVDGVMKHVISMKHTMNTGHQLMISGALTSSVSMKFNGYKLQVMQGTSSTVLKEIDMITQGNKEAVSKLMWSNNTGNIMSVLGMVGVGVTYYSQGVLSDIPTNHQNVVSSFKEAWTEMKDAGLVLPVDSAIPTYQGNALNYNAETDVYSGVEAGVVPSGDVTWAFPKPRIRTGVETDVTVPSGVYVDNPAHAYNPPIFGEVAVSVPATTNVITGATTAINTGTVIQPPAEAPVTTPKSGEPVNPFKVKPMPIVALTGLFQLLAALIFYLIRMFTFIATIALIAPTPIDNPYFLWFVDATFYGIKPFRLVQNLALFFLGFSVYRSVRRVFG